MAVSITSQYRLHDGQRDAFLNAVREANKLATSLGGRPVLRQTNMGGELTGIHSWIVSFPTSVARGTFLDEITRPENVARNAVVQLQREGGVTLLGRVFLNEVPATEEMSSVSQVLTVGRNRIAPGRLAEGEAALAEAKAIRQELGIESHVYTTANGGQSTGVHLLSTHAGSYKEAAEFLERITERTNGHGPIPRAQDSGALVLVGNTISTLVAL